MKTKLTILLITLTVLIPSFFSAQTISVPGFTGLTFEKRDSSYSIEISTVFNLHSMEIAPDSLWLNYNHVSNTFSMWGGLTFKIDSKNISVTLGDFTTPGIIINNETLEQVNFNVLSTFEIHGVTFSPNNLGVIWAKNNDEYNFVGSATASLEENSIKFNFGNTSTPGVVLLHGSVKEFNLSIDTDLTIHGTKIIAENLGAFWNSDSSEIQIYGTAKFILGNSTGNDTSHVSVSFGTQDSSSFSLKDGKIEEMGMTLEGAFHLFSARFLPKPLIIDYKSGEFNFYGDADFITSDGNDTISVSFGESADSGIVITNNKIENFILSITGNFNLKKVKIKPTGLTFYYNNNSSTYEIYGDCKILLETDTIDVNLGSVQAPGILYKNGSVLSINFGLTADFKVKSLRIKPDGLTFLYNKNSSLYEIYGDCKVLVEEDTINANLGTSISPGFSISNGKIQNINFGLTGNFKVKSVTISPINLTFMYNRDSTKYEIFGNCKVMVETDTIEANLGNSSLPGLTIKNGKIQNINFGLTGNFKVKSVTISPNNLTFLYNRNSTKYEIFGDCKVLVEADTIDVNLGNSDNPGLTIKSGKIENINFGLTASFNIKGIKIKPTGLTFEYNRDSTNYVIYGDCKVVLESDTIDVDLGTATDVGLKIKSGAVQHIHFGITADFKMKSLEFAPKGLTFEWDKQEKQFEMYGAAKLSVEGDSISIGLGNSVTPGIVIQSHKLKSLDVSITADFEMKGLSIKAKDLTIVWNSTKFEFYGTAGLNFSGDEVDVDFGNSTNPGIVLNNGKLYSFNIAVTSDLKLGALHVKTKSLGCSYNSSSKKYFLSGSVEVDAVYSLVADFGQNGLEIDASVHPDKIIIKDLTVELDNANLGAIDLKKIKLTFDEYGIKEADLKVSFPPGYQVEADMVFTDTSPQKLNSITIDFEATNFESVIEIPGTGVGIAKLSGSLNNINTPSQFSFNGDAILTLLGPMSLAGYQAALAELECQLAITHSSFSASAYINVGAYKDGAVWKGILGSGSLNMNVYSNGSSNYSMSAKIPSSPLIGMDASLNIDAQKDVSALLGVTFYVPGFVPHFGGKTLGGVSGALRWINHDSYSSYVAAWLHYHILFAKGDVGAKYNFGSHDLSLIGSGTINSIRREVGGKSNYQTPDKGTSNNTYLNIIRTFEIPEQSPQFIKLELNTGAIVDSAYVTVIGPEGIYELVKLDLIEETIEQDTLRFNYTYNYSKIDGDSLVYMALMPPNSKPSDLNNPTFLTPGEYQFVFSYLPLIEQVDSINLIVHTNYPGPKGTINALSNSDGSYNISLNYYAYLDDSISVKIYWTDSLHYSGYPIDSETFYSPSDTGYVSVTTTVRPEGINDNTPIYFYSIIDDKINPPYVTNFSQMISHTNPVNGQIYEVENGTIKPLKGVLVYLDETENNQFDLDSTGVTEFATTTDSTGNFRFNKSLERSNRINAVIPYGYVLEDSSPNTFPYFFDSTQGKVNLVYYIRKTIGEK